MNLEAATQRGAGLLDQKRPEWARTINCETLDTGLWRTCVLGQVEGPDLYTGGFHAITEDIDIFEHGFCALDYHDYPELTAHWQERIKERLVAA